MDTDSRPAAPLSMRMSRLLRERSVIALALLVAAGAASLLYVQSRNQQRVVEEIVRADADAYSRMLTEFRTLYTAEVVEPVRGKGIVVTHDYAAQEGAIPLPATMSIELAERLGQNGSGVRAALYSPYPFPWRAAEGGLRDDFARRAWDALSTDPETPYSRVEDIDGRRYLRYATADRMRQSCIDCHNTHPQTPRNDWKVGDVRGVLEVSVPMDTAVAHVAAGVWQQVLLFGLFGAVGVASIGLVVGNLRKSARDLEQRVADRTSEAAFERHLLRCLMDNLPDSIYFKDRESRFLRVNKAAAKWFGAASPDNVTGKTDFDLFASEHAQPAYDDEQQIIATGRPKLNMAEKETWPDGRVTWVSTSKLPLPDPDGQIIGTFGISRDITAMKQVEAELRSARDAAESANRAKSDFLANMSHEIRTPMNAIIGMTELMLDGELSKTQRDYAATVLTSAESLLTIINEILDFSKIEAGHLELESIDFELREEIVDMLRTLGARADRKHVELVWQVDSDVPRYVRGDPYRLRQVLLNLAGNAIKFTEHGEVAVDVACASLSESKVRLHFSVRDTGIGIPPDKRDRIFSAFTQADGSTTRQYGGTGLGLTISLRLVEAMGGRIELDSEPGVGSTFRFTIELGRARDTTGDELADWPDLREMPALVIDDNATNRELLRQILESWGMLVETVEGGPQAVDVLTRIASRGGPLPLLLSDVNMPGMDGFMLVEELRNSDALRDAVVILLTSGGRPGDAGRGRDLGVSAQLMKPVKSSELLEAVMVAVGRPVSAGGSAPATEADELPRLPALNILVAEDGKANQRLARALLEKWGHTVTIAENGRAAVELSREAAYDLILMDVQMPVLDGLEATRQIRGLEAVHGGHVPIVAMTARAMKGDRERCLDAGMDGYVAKPVRREELYAALAPFFDASAAGPVAPSAPPGPSHGLVDWEMALNLVDGSDELLRQVIEDTLSELPELTQQLEQALAEGRREDAARAAHTITAAGRTFGVAPLLRQAEQIEELAGAGQLEGIPPIVAALRETLGSLVLELQTRLQQPS